VAGFALSLSVAAFAQPLAMLVARYAALETTGLEGAGLLQAAMAAGLALFVVMRQPNALLLVPGLNRQQPPDQKFREAAEYLRVYALLVGAAALPLVLFPELWLYVVYSERFLAAAPYTYLFVTAQVLKLLAGVAVALLIGLDEIAAQLAITLIGLAGLAALSWLLAPTMGVTGIGLAALADGGLNLALSAWWLRRTFRFPALRMMAGPVALVAVVALAGAASSLYGGVSARVLIGKGVACVLAAGGGFLLARRQFN
jgi:O-antigen/teichoic acid export membrane protein